MFNKKLGKRIIILLIKAKLHPPYLAVVLKITKPRKILIPDVASFEVI
jgi:hypothetical protein